MAIPAIVSSPTPNGLRAFVRAFPLRARQTAWLLGAGASADAGVPTAGQLIDELLLILFCDENNERRDTFNLSDSAGVDATFTFSTYPLVSRPLRDAPLGMQAGSRG
jgi:hypothetical protein